MDELSLDEVFAELTDVQQQIDSLPDHNFAELHELRQRQRALKVRAQELRAATRTQDQIAKELADLHRARDEIYERRLSTVDTGPAGGAGGGGIDIRDVHKWNEAIDATWGLAEVEARIRALELERARRAEDDQKPPLRADTLCPPRPPRCTGSHSTIATTDGSRLKSESSISPPFGGSTGGAGEGG